MPRRSLLPMIILGSLVVGCGSSGSTSPGTTSNTSSNSGAGRTMMASYNGTTFSPTLLTSAYLNGQVSVNANDGTRSLLINALNVNSTGTVTFTLLQLGRVAGTFAFTVKPAAGGTSSVILIGSFDIKFP